MGRRALLNLGLAAMVVVLALVVWLEPGLERGEGPIRLTALAADEVGHVLIRRPGDDDIMLERRGGQWHMTAPIQAPANEFRIEPLLRVVEATSHARFEPAPGDLARYGLDRPRASLRIGDVRIEFGDTEPIDHRRYLRIGAEVHLVDDHYLHRLQAGWPSFVSNSLLPEGARLVRLELPEFTLEQDAEGRWAIEPEQDISMDALNRLVDAWTHARALFVDRYDGDAVQGTVAVTLAGAERPLEFAILESEVDLVLALPEAGLVYHLGSEQGARMLSPAPAFPPDVDEPDLP